MSSTGQGRSFSPLQPNHETFQRHFATLSQTWARSFLKVEGNETPHRVRKKQYYSSALLIRSWHIHMFSFLLDKSISQISLKYLVLKLLCVSWREKQIQDGDAILHRLSSMVPFHPEAAHFQQISFSYNSTTNGINSFRTRTLRWRSR